ncbi:hypothetical protein ACFL35_21570 [Candidatus Riflebacteria bacterium]
MKIILSRKGFDSAYGKVPSPIFPDSRLLSLPIPSKSSPIKYEDIKYSGIPVAKLVFDLSKGKIQKKYRAHLDPDLNKAARPRLKGWRPIFGQTGAAQGHLKKQGIAANDLFLFFGWFRKATIERDNRFGYIKGALDMHLIFGWLQVAEICPVNKSLARKYPWAAYHPHFYGDYSINDTLYIARKNLFFPGLPSTLPGGGTFEYFHPELKLTKPGSTKRTLWQLPAWFYPAGKNSVLTYNANPDNWQIEKDRVLLKSAGRGQEFVLDVDDYPDVIGWVKEFFNH